MVVRECVHGCVCACMGVSERACVCVYMGAYVCAPESKRMRAKSPLSLLSLIE